MCVVLNQREAPEMSLGSTSKLCLVSRKLSKSKKTSSVYLHFSKTLLNIVTYKCNTQ